MSVVLRVGLIVVSVLTQQLAIEKFERYCNDREMKNEDSSDQTDFLDNDKA